MSEYPRLSKLWRAFTGLPTLDTSQATISQVFRALLLAPVLLPFFLFDIWKHWGEKNATENDSGKTRENRTNARVTPDRP
jgi:hypothetical protein